MTDHAKLSASGAHKWLRCPLSVWLEEEIPEKPSAFAAEGTKAHALAEIRIKQMLKPPAEVRKQLRKELKALEPIDEEMKGFVDGFVDYVKERYATARRKFKNAILLSETRLDYSRWVPDGFGTGDVVIVTDGYIEIIDLKYGKGVRVNAVNNPQLKLYALGALEEFDYLFDTPKIHTVIYQPRLDHIADCTYATEDLLRWANDTVAPSAKAVMDHQGGCVPGEHCDKGFCRARPICKAYSADKLRLADYGFTRPEMLTLTELSDVLSKAEVIAGWVTMVKAYALDQLLDGNDVPGYKAVAGKSRRVYMNEDDILAALHEHGIFPHDVTVTKLIGITEMQKKLGKDNMEEWIGKFIAKPEGAPCLAPEDDPRPAVHRHTAHDDFKDLIEKEN